MVRHEKLIYVDIQKINWKYLEELRQYLPEGLAGTLEKEYFPIFPDDKRILLRQRTHSVIQELSRRQNNGFVGRKDSKSIILGKFRSHLDS